MNTVLVHEHALKHGLGRADIAYAWANFIAKRARGSDYWVAVGFGARGREIEMVAAELADGDCLVIHAMSPATQKIKHELGLGGMRRGGRGI